MKRLAAKSSRKVHSRKPYWLAHRSMNWLQPETNRRRLAIMGMDQNLRLENPNDKSWHGTYARIPCRKWFFEICTRRKWPSASRSLAEFCIQFKIPLFYWYGLWFALLSTSVLLTVFRSVCVCRVKENRFTAAFLGCRAMYLKQKRKYFGATPRKFSLVIYVSVFHRSTLDKNDFKNASTYIIKKFEQQIVDKTKLIYPHLTCATGKSLFALASLKRWPCHTLIFAL